MPQTAYFSTAYLPPAEYFARLLHYDIALLEREENYLKQSYRNRCYILSAGGPQMLTVPVLAGSRHKTLIKDIRIDYTKRWQQVHVGALASSYRSSPFYLYYSEMFEKTILNKYDFLLDLNMDLIREILTILKSNTTLTYTTEFIKTGNTDNDFRYNINPKLPSKYRTKPYPQVFDVKDCHPNRLSIVDLIFNAGPETVKYL